MKRTSALKTGIARLFKAGLEAGMHDALNDFEARRVQVLNIMNLALILFSSVFAIFQILFLNQNLSPGFLLIDSLNLPVGLLSLYLTTRRRYDASRLVAIVGNIIIALVLRLCFNDSGTELFGLLGLISAGFFLEKPVLIVSVSLFSMVSYLVLDSYGAASPKHFNSLGVVHQCVGLTFIFVYLYAMKLVMSRFHIQLTAQKELMLAKNNELQEVNELKTRLFSIVSHDLRGPMGAFEEYLKEFKDTNLSTAELQSISGEMLRDVEAINLLIKNLLRWSRDQLTEQTVKCERLDIAELITDNCKLFELQASHKNITLRASLTKEYLLAFGDRDITNTIIRNLMSNAIKFSHAGTPVDITATSSGEGISISITDYGKGMTLHQIEAIFKQKGNSTHGTHREKGSGLGLLLTQQLLHKQGGQLRISSEPDRGTTISFDMPRYKRELVAV